MADDDDRSRDSPGAPGSGWPQSGQPDVSWADAVAPDDISALARDVNAYRRERRTVRRHERFRRLTRGAGATPFALVIAALALVGIVTTLLSLMGPRALTPPAASRLAATTMPTGQPGGALPAVGLQSSAGPVNSVSLRPGAVVLLSRGCDCDATVTQLDAQAQSVQGLPLFVVAPSERPNPDADSLLGQVRNPDEVFYDSYAALRTAVHARGLTVVEVNADGTIYAIDKNVTSANNLRGELLGMLANPETAT